MDASRSTAGLSPVAERIVLDASDAVEHGQPDPAVAVLHFMAATPDSAAGDYLRAHGMTPSTFPVEHEPMGNRVFTQDLQLAAGVAGIVARAREIAASLSHPIAGTEHLLIAVVDDAGQASCLLAAVAGDAAALRAALFGGTRT